MCISFLSEDGNKFYAESSEFKGDFPNYFSPRFSPPQPGEDEYWMWTKKCDVDIRGTNKEISINIKDWFQALSGGALSWVDYSEFSGGPGYRNIKPIDNLSIYTVYFKNMKDYDVYDSIFREYLSNLNINAIILEHLRTVDNQKLPDLEKFSEMYHSNRPFSSCEVIRSYVRTIEKL
jgi:hypothetical protein